MPEPEEVELSPESARRFAKQVADAVESRRRERGELLDIPIIVKEEAKPIIEAVMEGLNNKSISEAELLREYFVEMKRAMKREEKQPPF